KAKNLSAKSNNVYQLLNYIKQFKLYEHKNYFGEKLSTHQVINEIYTSLIRFKYFKALPSRFLVNLYPLNKDNKNHSGDSNLRDDTLTLFNTELYDVIKKYEGFEDVNFTEDEKEKINYCLTRLMFAGISHIAKPSQKPDSFCYYSNDRNTVVSLYEKIRKIESCDCINCSIEHFAFDKALVSLHNYRITENSDLHDDLMYAYGFVQIYDNYNAFVSFKQILVKVNKLKRLDVSFLSKYNMFRLGRRAYAMYGGTVESKDIDPIKEEADNIDLDAELNKAKYFVDKEVFQFLREIKNGVYIQNLCDEIDDKYNDIPKTKALIQSGGGASNSHIYNLYKANVGLKNFIEDNFIIG